MPIPRPIREMRSTSSGIPLLLSPAQARLEMNFWKEIIHSIRKKKQHFQPCVTPLQKKNVNKVDKSRRGKRRISLPLLLMKQVEPICRLTPGAEKRVDWTDDFPERMSESVMDVVKSERVFPDVSP